MTSELVPSGVGSLDEQSMAALMASLITLTTDAVILFDARGTILLANDEADQMFRGAPSSLVGSNVRLLFPPAATIAEFEGPLEGSVPFALDGSTCTIVCEGSEGTHVPVVVRCAPVRGAQSMTYLLVAHAMEAGEGADPLVLEELTHANKRLSGTLRIILGTLDSLDVGTLFSRVLDQITDTMDAWATMTYVAESKGLRLGGRTSALADVSVPTILGHGHPLVELASHRGQAISLRVSPPTREDLRAGDLADRTLVEERSGLSIRVPVQGMPPFASLILVPVWFGGQMISLLIVGWRHVHRLGDEDLRLIDAVAEYLSVQLAGAFAAMRAQHAERIGALGSTLREQLMAKDSVSVRDVEDAFVQAADGLDALLVSLEGNPHQPLTMATLPDGRRLNAPLDLAALARAQGMPCVVDMADVDGLVTWAEKQTGLTLGLLCAVCALDGAIQGFLLLLDEDEDEFEDVDIAFVRRLAEDVAEVQAGERARSRDKHIAQALQRGMRNELQVVDGLDAQSRYSSATEAAFVGGDFYDLIRLPHEQACAIMGDVSGKGVEAASVSSAVKTALGAYSWEGLSPARMVGLLNDFLLGFSRIETFATLFVGMVDLGAGTLTYCSAGHPPALLVRAESGEIVTLGVQSGVVGAFEGMTYRDGEVSLRAGDMLLLYTDGVTEARNRDGAFFGEDGLRDAVARESAQGFDGLCDRLLESVRAFCGRPLEDDVALVVLRYG